MADAMDSQSIDAHGQPLRALDHRVRNNYAALLSLVDLTRGGTTDVREFATAISGHIRAIAVSHDLLSRSGFQTLELKELVVVLGRANMLNSLSLQGPTVQVASRQSVALSLVLQVLLTSAPRTDAVQINWNWTAESQRQLHLTFKIVDAGLPSLEPWKTSLVEGLVRSELRGQIQGIRGQFELSLALDPSRL
jgi:two-component sensor histidine kinase